MNLEQYKTLVFDCDGVVLNSNKVKTQAFYTAALPYGEAAAQSFVAYHIANGGVSRYAKFAFFLEHIAPFQAQGPSLDQLLSTYAKEVRTGLMTCALAPGLRDLRKKTAHTNWLIVSGGDQAELRDVFKSREIEHYFDGGIFGSPDAKEKILARELASNNIQKPALFIGDSKYDYQVATAAGLDFVFMSGWSEVKAWQDWVREEEIQAKVSISSLLKIECPAT